MPTQTRSFSDLITFTRASNATYFDSEGVLRRAASNASRIDYNPSTLAVRGLLVEEQRTNLITYSEDFNNSIWQLLNSPIISQNFATAPNGSTSADLISTSVSASGLYRFITTTNSTVHTMSIFLKYVSGGTTVYFGCDSGPSNAYVTADISVGTITSSGVNVTSSSITNVGNGWYRITVTFTTTTTTPTIIIYSAGSAARSFLTWGAQLEAGAFATSYIPSSVTFSGRTSTGTYFDSAGVLQTAGSGVSRTTYNPSNLTADPFLLLEESRTNSIRNNTMAGAVAGTPGTNPTNWDITSSGTGIIQQIVGTGIEDGITYIDVRFFGIGSGSASPQIRPETTTQIVAASGQTWTSSYYLRIVSGSTTGCSGTFQQIWQERDAAGVSLNTITVSISDPTTAALRTQSSILTRTLTDAGTARLTNRIQWTFDNGVAVDITLRIGMPQLEQGAYSTSVIPTSSAAVTRAADTSTSATATRAADVALVNNLDPWFNPEQYTIFYEGIMLSLIDGAVQTGVANTFDDTTYIATSPSVISLSMRSGGTSVSPLSFSYTASGVPFKAAVGAKQNDSAFCLNGGTVSTYTSVNLPLTTTRLGIGNAPWSASGGNQKQQWIRSIKYYPRRLTNAELKAITT